MNPSLSQNFRCPLAAIVALLLTTAFPPVHAANVTWSSAGTSSAGGNGTWTGGSTWWNGSSGVSWTTGDNATFSAAGNTTVNSAVTAGGITFTSSSANISILDGAGNLTVNTGITATNSANTTALTYTISESSLILGGNNTWTVNNGGTVGTTNLSVSSAISGSYGLTKAGNGTLTLSGANSFTGPIAVQNGSLFISSFATNLGSSSIKFGSGTNSGAIRYTGSGTTETISNTIDLAGSTGGGAIQGGGSNTNYTITFNGDLSSSAASNKSMDFLGSGSGTIGNFIYNGLISNSSGNVSIRVGGSGSANLTLTNVNNSFSGGVSIRGNTASQTYNLITSQIGNAGSNSTLGTGGTISIGSSGSGTNVLKYTGTGETTDKVIDLASTANTNQASLDASNASGLLKFTSNFTATGTASSKILNLIGTGNAEIAGAIVNNSAVNVTNLTKSGTSTWTLSGNNTYNGTTTISAGTLQIGSGGTTGSLNTTSAITNNAILAFNRSDTITQGTDFASVISGNASGALVQNGSGTLVLSGANTYGGATTINAGNLSISSIANGGSASNIGQSSNASSNLVLGGGTLLYTGANASTDRNFTLSNGTTSGINISQSGTSLTLSGTSAAGNGSLTKSGAGTLILSSNNATTGTTTISAGTLVLNGNLSGGAAIIIAETGVLTQGAASVISGTSALTQNSSGTSTLAGNNTYTGTTTISAGTLQIGSGSTSGAVAGSIANNANLVFNRSNTLSFSGNISGSGNLTQAGSGTLSLGGVNSYTGLTTISAGTLGLNGAGTTIAGDILINGGALAYDNTTNGQLGAGVDITLSSGSFTLGARTESISSIAMGGGSLSKGGGALAFSTDSSFTGGTITLTAATAAISVGGVTTLGDATFTTASTISSGSGLILGGNVSMTSGTANFSVSGAGSGRIDLGGAARTFDISNAQLNAGWIMANGTSGIVKSGNGTLNLTAANSYTGTTTINAGTLSISGGAALSDSGAVSLANTAGAVFQVNASETIASLQGGGSTGGNVGIASGQTLTIAEAGTNTFSGAITGAGGLTKSSSGSLTLANANNSFSGGVWIQQGTLYADSIGNAGANSFLGTNSTIKFGSGSNGGNLRLTNGSPIETTDKVIELAGTTGGGTLTAGNATITMTSDVVMSGSGNKTLSFNSSGNTNTFNLTFNGLLADGGPTSVLSVGIGGSGNSNIILGNGNNSFSGQVTINANTASTTTTLSAASFGMTGNNSALGRNGTISIGSSSSTAVNGLRYTGTGETSDKNINLSGGATGGVRIDQSGASGQLVLTGNITNTGSGNKSLTLQGSTAGTGVISGIIADSAGGNATNVTKSGNGTWTLSGNNTYTGATTISAGTLVLNGTNSGSAITVNSGGTLAGSGTGGTTTVNSGGKISPGNSPGILTVGNLTINGNSTYTWEMADATGSAGTGWDQINATGLLTVGSNATSKFNIAITSAGNPTNWNFTTSNQSWDIIDYGTISGFNASYFTLNTTAFGGDLTGDSSWALSDTGSALRLTYSYIASAPTYAGGTGVWSTEFSPPISNSANAIFIGAGGTATNDIASATLSNIGSLTFDGINSYTLEANSGSAGFNSASALAIGGAITNNATVAQTINIATSFAANQTINANTGPLQIGGNMAIATGATVTIVGSNATTITGIVSGLGALTKNSSGTLTLSGNNTYSGNTIIGQGKVLLGHDNAFGTGSVKLGISGVTANITIASTDSTARTISNVLDGVAGNSWTTTFGEASGGTGALSFANTTAVNLNGAARTFQVLNTTTFANAFVSTSGSIIKTGSGTMILTGGSTYNGSTTINAGTLQIGNGGTTGSLSTGSAITNNGTLVFNRSNSVTQGATFASTIAGTGSLIQAGTGTLTLAGNNTYTGGTSINAGVLALAHSGALGTTGTISFGGGQLQFTANNTTDYSTRFSTAPSQAYNFDTNGQNVALAGNLTSSGGSLTKNGSGTLSLNGTNTYTGVTTINAGTLRAAAAGATGNSSQIVMNNSGSLLVTAANAVNDSTDINLNGGTLAVSGSFNENVGLLTLSANSTIDFAGFAGTLRFGGIGSWATGANLAIWNWSGIPQYGPPVNDYTNPSNLVFATGTTITDEIRNSISFYSGSGTGFIGTGFERAFDEAGFQGTEILAVPEPETYFTAIALLLMAITARFLHKRQRI